MSKSNYSGSCHCGAVQFSCELDDSQPTSRCNCSVCSKTRMWKSEPLPAGSFKLTKGADSLTEYRFNSRRVAHMFCRHCGMKLFGHGGTDYFSNEFYVVNVAVLDGLSDERLAALPVVFQDGRNNDWEAVPTHTSYL
jgi:hypothetical protein